MPRGIRITIDPSTDAQQGPQIVPSNMPRKIVRLWAVIVLAGTLALGMCASAAAETDTESDARKWAVSLYYARLNDGALDETLTFSANSENSSLLVLALSRRFYTFRDWFDLEFEGQVAKHFQEQNHCEFNLLGTFRWIKFPWDQYVDTSVAAGAGLSYATAEPEIELKNHENVSKFLGYLMFEVAFSLPPLPQWDLFARIHHRSGAGGTFAGVEGASNAYGIGIRYKY